MKCGGDPRSIHSVEPEQPLTITTSSAEGGGWIDVKIPPFELTNGDLGHCYCVVAPSDDAGPLSTHGRLGLLFQSGHGFSRFQTFGTAPLPPTIMSPNVGPRRTREEGMCHVVNDAEQRLTFSHLFFWPSHSSTKALVSVSGTRSPLPPRRFPSWVRRCRTSRRRISFKKFSVESECPAASLSSLVFRERHVCALKCWWEGEEGEMKGPGPRGVQSALFCKSILVRNFVSQVVKLQMTSFASLDRPTGDQILLFCWFWTRPRVKSSSEY